MFNIKTDREKELESRVTILGQALRQVLDGRTTANKAVAEHKFWANYYADRYHITWEELVKNRLMLADADKMIQALLNDGNQKPPDIKLGDDKGPTV